jgi:hypothetical protein
MTIKQEIRAFKYKLIRGALELNEGNIRKTARSLGCTNTLLGRWMREVGLVDYGRSLRRRRDWWLVSVCAEVFVFAVMVVYASPALG